MQYPQYFVQFSGWFEDDHNIYLAMKYVECGDLAGLLLDDDMAEDDVKTITTQLLNGLEVMHENNFCHRDLKPQVGLLELVSA